MKRVLFFVGVVVSVVCATNARVESMGKTATFFMDDISIYENPANVSIYPNFLIGEPGRITLFKDTSSLSENQDPSAPYGGGIISFSLNKDREADSRYPLLSFGVMLNRQNEMVSVLREAAEANNHVVPTPVVPNSDFFVGYAMPGGAMVGGHLYAARQSITVPVRKLASSASMLAEVGIFMADSIIDSITASYYARDLVWTSNAVKGDLGLNIPIGQNRDLEFSFGLGMLNYHGNDYLTMGNLAIPSYTKTDLSYFVSSRLFSTMVSLNGEIVPVVKYKKISVRSYEKREFELGIGANVTLDRGFFWFGTEWINGTVSKADGSEINRIDVPISFGIERNVVWDWLVLRVGFRKTIWGVVENSDGVSMNFTNPEADMTVNDHVGGGIGINIEEKLKIDAVMAEDILYKWGNLLSGNSHHIFSRITATYSF